MSDLLVAVDANSQLHKLYHAMGAQAAAGVFMAYLDAFRRLFAGKRASNVFVAFDGADGTKWRKELDPSYKGNRSEKAADLLELLEQAMVATMDMGYEVLAPTDCEADDVIAAIVARHNSQRVMMVSADKDLFQLLEPGRVNQLRSFSVVAGSLNKPVFFTAAQLVEKFGVHPHQWPAYRALVGDKSDGMSGILDCGPKKAVAILSGCRDLADALSDRWRIPDGIRDRVMRAWESGQLASWERIATLRRDCLDCVYAEGGA